MQTFSIHPVTVLEGRGGVELHITMNNKRGTCRKYTLGENEKGPSYSQPI